MATLYVARAGGWWWSGAVVGQKTPKSHLHDYSRSKFAVKSNGQLGCLREIRNWGERKEREERSVRNLPLHSSPDRPPFLRVGGVAAVSFLTKKFAAKQQIVVHQLTLGATWRHAQSLHLSAFSTLCFTSNFSEACPLSQTPGSHSSYNLFTALN